MKIIFYSVKEYEKPYLEAADKNNHTIMFEQMALSLHTADKAKGFDAVSIFTGDDASAEVLAVLAKNNVKYIAVRAAGYDNTDIKAAAKLGLKVANVPAYSPYAIAEHAVALILALNRKIVLADHNVHLKNFSIENLIGFDLKNKTIGIIGTGRIGSVFAGIMHGFGCRLTGYDIFENISLQEKYGLRYADMDTLCRESDIISIHTCLTPQTKYIINKKWIDIMQHGIMLINTSRGGCINTADVIEGLTAGRIGYYGADVYENEKGVFFHDHSHTEIKDEMLMKLLSFPNVLITPHQAFATKEALSNIASTTFENINCWERRQRCENELTEEHNYA